MPDFIRNASLEEKARKQLLKNKEPSSLRTQVMLQSPLVDFRGLEQDGTLLRLARDKLWLDMHTGHIETLLEQQDISDQEVLLMTQMWSVLQDKEYMCQVLPEFSPKLQSLSAQGERLLRMRVHRLLSSPAYYFYKNTVGPHNLRYMHSFSLPEEKSRQADLKVSMRDRMANQDRTGVAIKALMDSQA